VPAPDVQGLLFAVPVAMPDREVVGAQVAVQEHVALGLVAVLLARVGDAALLGLHGLGTGTTPARREQRRDFSSVPLGRLGVVGAGPDRDALGAVVRERRVVELDLQPCALASCDGLLHGGLDVPLVARRGREALGRVVARRQHDPAHGAVVTTEALGERVVRPERLDLACGQADAVDVPVVARSVEQQVLGPVRRGIRVRARLPQLAVSTHHVPPNESPGVYRSMSGLALGTVRNVAHLLQRRSWDPPRS
jgi:hypothetical protein